MQLTQLAVHNFRSVRDLTCSLERISIFLGPNNHGKSNLLAAVDFLLSPGTKITAEDFFAGRGDDDNRLFVDAVFTALTEQEKNTFKKYLRADGSICIRRWARLDNSGDVETGYRGYLERPTVWWLQDEAFERLKTREAIGAEAAVVPELNTLLEGSGRITKDRVAEFQAKFVEEHRADLGFEQTLEETPFLGAKSIAGGILPDFYLVPAVRDLGDETKTTGSAMFSRLLQRAVSEMTARDPRFVELQESLGRIVDQLNERPNDPNAEPSSELDRLERTIKTELTPWGVDVNIRVTPPEVRKVFELGTELWLDDGHPTVAQRKGHGLQRAVIFALIRAWSAVLRNVPAEAGPKARAASDSLVIAYEEPELFLHPHAQRTLADSLKAIAGTPEHQVLMCTHSTHFVDLENYRSIIIVRRPDTLTGTKVTQCMRELFAGEADRERKSRFHMSAWVNPDRGELFFASKVILVEGETEKTVLPYVARKLGCLDRQVSVIDCGSKHNLALYVEILNAFGLKYAVIHDEDPIPEPPPPGWKPEKLREKQRTYALNEEIRGLVRPGLGQVEMFSPDFEAVSAVSAAQGEKKGKPLAALDHFAGVAPDDVPARVAEVVRRAFSTEEP